MLGGFIGSNGNRGSDWGENLLSSVASNTIRHLFTRSDSVEVKVSCQPSSKLLQGSIDSFKMLGQGLVIRQDFRTEELSFETDAVSIDFSSVLKGKIDLKQPTQAIAQIKLLESDINEAFQARLVKRRLENLTEPALVRISKGEPVSFGEVQLKLLVHNQLQLSANARFGQQRVPLSLSCTLGVEKRRKVQFKDIQFLGDGIPAQVRSASAELTSVLGEILNDMIDLDRFDLDGIVLRLNR
ncbi:MAG: DUF2993 domain-containing protein, partial [Cyanobacteria bacterium P01_H01_bin.15]